MSAEARGEKEGIGKIPNRRSSKKAEKVAVGQGASLGKNGCNERRTGKHKRGGGTSMRVLKEEELGRLKRGGRVINNNEKKRGAEGFKKSNTRRMRLKGAVQSVEEKLKKTIGKEEESKRKRAQGHWEKGKESFLFSSRRGGDSGLRAEGRVG